MKKIYFIILLFLLCFLHASCVVIPGAAIVGLAVTGVADTESDISGPSFIFPEDANGRNYANIGADIKVYSNNGEWRPNNKYHYVIGKIVSGGSAEIVGIKENDVMHSINGRLTERMSPHEVWSDLIGGSEEIVSLYIIDNEYLKPQFVARVTLRKEKILERQRLEQERMQRTRR